MLILKRVTRGYGVFQSVLGGDRLDKRVSGTYHEPPRL